MQSQPAAPNSDDDAPNESKRIVKHRHKDDSSLSNTPIETEKDALRSFRERLKRSSHRPQWWSDHMRSLFR